MNAPSLWKLGTVVLALTMAGMGYWLGFRSAGNTPPANSAAAAPAATASAAKAPKLLYYRNPMGLPDTSPTPKKDSMGMDYIAVYEGADTDTADSSGGIRISTEKVQKLGVRTEPAARRVMDAVVRSSARVETDERRVYTVAAKFEGYIDKLHVNATNQTITKGQALFEVYSPELVSAQREYLIAVQGQGQLKDAPATAQDSMRQLADSALLRLKNWDISDEQIRRLRTSTQAQRTVSFLAPVSGVVIEKKAQQGMRFMPGEMLYQVADLSTVWVVADVPEHDLAQVRLGATAQVHVAAYPGQSYAAKVSYIYPRLTIETRTVGVRLELPNRKGLLKPGMFAQVELSTPAGGKVLAVPESSVLDSGTRSVVLVQTAGGRFEPRAVVLGRRSAGYVQVLQGVNEGDAVVVAANFLIDAESNLKAALQGLSPATGASAPATGATGGKAVGYQASGKVVSVDTTAETATLAHGPVPALKWPGMTMDFKVANNALLKDLTPGRTVQFEFVERAQGEWVITAVQAGSTAAAHAH